MLVISVRISIILFLIPYYLSQRPVGHCFVPKRNSPPEDGGFSHSRIHPLPESGALLHPPAGRICICHIGGGLLHFLLCLIICHFQSSHISLDHFGLLRELMSKGSLHLGEEILSRHDTCHCSRCSQHGGVGEIPAECLLGNVPCVNRKDSSLITAEKAPDLPGGFGRIDDDRALPLQQLHSRDRRCWSGRGSYPH